MSEHKHVIKFDVKTYPCECGLEFSQELAETLVEAALRGSLPTVQLGIDLEFEKRRVAELKAEVTKGHELQDSYCDRIAELEAEVTRLLTESDDAHMAEARYIARAELAKRDARIAELKVFINQLIDAGESVAMGELNSYYSWIKLIDDWKEG